MKLTVTFDIDGQHQHTYRNEIDENDLLLMANRIGFGWLSTWISDMLLNFIVEVKYMHDRVEESST